MKRVKRLKAEIAEAKQQEDKLEEASAKLQAAALEAQGHMAPLQQELLEKTSQEA